MESNKHKSLTNHVIIVTSDAVDANVKQFKIKTWILILVVMILFALVGALIGYLFYEERIWQAAIDKSNRQLQTMENLQKENEQVKAQLEERELELNDQIQALMEDNQVLSSLLNQKIENEKALTDELAAFSLPTSFPLNGAASSMELADEVSKVVKIKTTEGVMVVAAAKGTVIAVNDELEFGHNVWVDHGNGYVTIYRNLGEPVVKQGDIVYQGTTLFVVGEDNQELGYQIMINGDYVNPLDVIDIKG